VCVLTPQSRSRDVGEKCHTSDSVTGQATYHNASRCPFQASTGVSFRSGELICSAQPSSLNIMFVTLSRLGLSPRKKALFDNGVNAPISVHHLGHPEVDGYRDQRDCLVLAIPSFAPRSLSTVIPDPLEGAPNELPVRTDSPEQRTPANASIRSRYCRRRSSEERSRPKPPACAP